MVYFYRYTSISDYPLRYGLHTDSYVRCWISHPQARKIKGRAFAMNYRWASFRFLRSFFFSYQVPSSIAAKHRNIHGHVLSRMSLQLVSTLYFSRSPYFAHYFDVQIYTSSTLLLTRCTRPFLRPRLYSLVTPLAEASPSLFWLFCGTWAYPFRPAPSSLVLGWI